MRKLFVALVMLLSITLNAQDSSEFVLPSIISNHAVMKRNANVKLWGWCPGDWNLKIVCSWAETDTIYVHSNKYNYWETKVDTPDEEGPYSIQFYGRDNRLCANVEDILMGEPWLCSGQSNMEYCFKWRVDDLSDRSELFKDKKIRIFKVAKASSTYPVERISGKWEICDLESVEDFSVVAYFFGKHLHDSLNEVPVGLIGSYWGGTAIEPWLDDMSISNPQLERLTKSLAPSWAPTANSSIYHAMIYPLLNYKLSGIIWYQGEANVERVDSYKSFFTSLIEGWRRSFKDELPFLFVQIAPWTGYSGINGALLRESQAEVAKSTSKTGMAIISDLVNDLDDIHPALKKQVGKRLANLALVQVYNQKQIQPYSPEFKSLEIKEKKAIVSTTVGRRLVNTSPDINKNSDIDIDFSIKVKKSPKNKDIPHFELVDSKGGIYPATAKLCKNGNLCVSSDRVKKPVGVRYCFSNASEPTLFDLETGLPLGAFRVTINDSINRKAKIISTIKNNKIPFINGSFIQEFLVRNWDAERWDAEMQMLLDSGMEYLVLAPTLLVDKEGNSMSYYPSSLACNYSGVDVVDACLRSAEKVGIKVFLGLNFNERWWNVDYNAYWLLQQMQKGNQVAFELVKRYKDKYPKSMHGWYWVWEIDNYNAASLEAQNFLAEALNTNLDYLTALTPDMPVMFSPFMNYRLGTAEECKDLWTNIFEKVRFRKGDIFSPQDCIGAGGLRLEVLDEWFRNLKKAVSSKPELEFWANVETFEQEYWTSAPLLRLVKQLKIVDQYVDNILSFAYCHYYSPYNVHPDYHAVYLKILEEGKEPNWPRAAKIAVMKSKMETDGVLLSWHKREDCMHTVGFSIYKNGILYHKVSANLKKQKYEWKDVDGEKTDSYKIVPYNALGKETL